MLQGKLHRWVLGFVKLSGAIPAALFFKPRIYYQDRAVQGRKLPKGCILMSNHQALLDFALYLILFFGRTIRFQMAEVLFRKGKLFAWFLFALGGIYVDRDSADFTFIEDSIDLLEQGSTVGIFPQGRLPVNGKPFPFKPGIVYTALQSGAPIIPVYTDGNYGLKKRVSVVIGAPIHLKEYCAEENPDPQTLQKLTLLLEQKTYELKEYLPKA